MEAGIPDAVGTDVVMGAEEGAVGTESNLPYPTLSLRCSYCLKRLATVSLWVQPANEVTVICKECSHKGVVVHPCVCGHAFKNHEVRTFGSKSTPTSYTPPMTVPGGKCTECVECK